MPEDLNEADPVGGWIKEFGVRFDNAIDARELDFTRFVPGEGRRR